MLNKIKFLGIIFLSILLLTNCNKDNKQDPTELGELVFAPIDVTPDKDWKCDPNLTAVYAHVVIDGKDYYPLTFVLDKKLYTQAIKLPKGGHVLEYFALMDDMGTPDKGDDKIYKATPQFDSDYAIYVELVLPYKFTIIAFQKFEMKIWVLCYIRAHYTYFGFFWFEVHEIIVREQCFFGDFCIKYLSDYYESDYDDPIDGVEMDEKAIFMIKAWRGDDYLGEFNNDLVYRRGLPLCIQYADRLDMLDIFKFELWIYVKVGVGFEYVKFHTWTFKDAEMIPNGRDGVVDFILGNCGYAGTPPDLLLPPYMNLPCDFVYKRITGEYPAGFFAYFMVELSEVGAGYDFFNGKFETWCADKKHTIGTQKYDMCAYSSLYPWLLPPSCLPSIDWTLKGKQLNRVNWLFNNLDLLPKHTTKDFQLALWIIFGDLPNEGGVSGAIANLAGTHGDFKPLPGDWAAVLMYDLGGKCVNTQITFIVVDP